MIATGMEMAIDRSIEERLSHVQDGPDEPHVRWFAWDRAVMSEATGTVCHMEKSNLNRDNDQRLILAAPEMLAALRLVQSSPIDVDVLATVDAAIKAATAPERASRVVAKWPVVRRQARKCPQVRDPTSGHRVERLLFRS